MATDTPPEDRAARLARLLEEVDWVDTTRRLTMFAFAATKRVSMELAKDLAQEAMTQLLDPRYQDWDPEREPVLLTHLCNVVRGLASNRRRMHSVQRERLVSAEKLAARTGDDPPHAGSAVAAMRTRGEVPDTPAAKRVVTGPSTESTEERAILREHALATAEAIERRFAGDPNVLKLVELAKKGVCTMSEQAEATGLTFSEVHNARKRLFRGLGEIERELDPGTPRSGD
jgi:hypothetical protein